MPDAMGTRGAGPSPVPRYMRTEVQRPSGGLERHAFVVLGDDDEKIGGIEVALATLRLARRLGIQAPVPYHPALLPYATANDNVMFDAVLTSLVAGARIRYLRGWKQYASCVKGWNALGLIADLVLRELARLGGMSTDERRLLLHAFLASRRQPGDAGPVFGEDRLPAALDSAAGEVALLDLAVWRVCGRRTIVCSTSSNMGIALHQVLRGMQATAVRAAGREFRLLNEDEGRLIIWCPDEEADFMHPEKTAALRALERETPALTTLHTYINRRQRDPGALKDALALGGYFFPTNPQSKDELQNLLVNALRDLATERGCREQDLLHDETVGDALAALGCAVDRERGRVVVRRAVEAGLQGLMAAYLLMLEETLPLADVRAISTWNQASIGAALGAAILADMELRRWERLAPAVRAELAALLPRTAAWLEGHTLGRDVQTRVHGLFDIANIQSLAQLLGVVIQRHLSGRSTAYVGLGSSSYANGNRCFEILRQSEEHGGPFHGRDTFHPATHTVNPVAQALVLADDLLRAVPAGATTAEAMPAVTGHVRKPEPAGAAALAGYLLARLDSGTLSVPEIAYGLRLAGFDAPTFLELAGYRGDGEGAAWYVQEASEEGPYMAGFAESLLHCLQTDLDELETLAGEERQRSREEYRRSPLDPPDFEALRPLVNIYLTGDNTGQPAAELLARLVRGHLANRERLERALHAVAMAAPPVFADVEAAALAPARARHAELVEQLRRTFEANAERVCLVDTLRGRTLTYAELHGLGLRAARFLAACGLERGDRVALLLPNGPTFAASYLACLMTGIVAVPINPLLTASEVAVILDVARVDLVLFAEPVAEKLALFQETRATRCMQVVEASGIGAAASRPAWFIDDPEPGPHVVPFAGARDDDVFVMLFTSGTTARPKGVVHTVGSELGNAVAFNGAMGFDRASRFYHVWPMAYSTGLLNTLLCPLMAGASVVLGRPFDARTALDFWGPAIEHGVDTLWLSPTMMAILLSTDRDPRTADYCREHVRTVCCGTAPLPATLRRRFEARYGVPVYESYGLSELLICTAERPGPAGPGPSVGRALPGVSVRLASGEAEMTDAAGPGLGGEVLVATPYAMAGYLDALTGDIVRLEPDTFFATGDLGALAPSGELTISGRKKDLILRGGVLVSPAAVREVLLRHEAVEDAVVVGVPHEVYGEEVAAALRLRPGTRLESVQAALIAHCRAHLQPGSIPARFIAVDQFPTGTSGKVLSREVQRLFAAPSGRQRPAVQSR